MIGEIRYVLLPYYDVKAKKNRYKKRPALVIAQADKSDYVILPISRITRKEHRHPIFDIEIDPDKYPESNLTQISFVRTHKQTIAHNSAIADKISSFSDLYQEMYNKILDIRELFQTEVYFQNKHSS